MKRKSYFVFDDRWLGSLVQLIIICTAAFFFIPVIPVFWPGLVILVLLYGFTLFYYPCFLILDDEGIRVYYLFGLKKRTYLWRKVQDVDIRRSRHNIRIALRVPCEEEAYSDSIVRLPLSKKTRRIVEQHTGKELKVYGLAKAIRILREEKKEEERKKLEEQQRR